MKKESDVRESWEIERKYHNIMRIVIYHKILL